MDVRYYFIASLTVIGLMPVEDLRAESDAGTSAHVRDLVENLDSPIADRRASAERELLKMQVQNLPLLEELNEDLTFEARERLQRIVMLMKQRQVGVILAAVYQREVDDAVGVGDLVYSLEDQPVEDRTRYYALLKKHEGDEVRVGTFDGDQQGTVTVKKDYLQRAYVEDTHLDYRRWHCWAIRSAFARQYTEASGHIEEATKAGLDLDRAEVTLLWYAYCLYYTGDRKGAYERIERYAALRRERNESTPYIHLTRYLMNYLEEPQKWNAAYYVSRIRPHELIANDGDLGLFVIAHALKETTDPTIARLWRSNYAGQVLRDYRACLEGYVGDLHHYHPGHPEYCYWARGNFFRIFNRMGLREELLTLASVNLSANVTGIRPRGALYAAMAGGDIPLVRALGELYQEQEHTNTLELYRMYELTSQYDEIHKLLREYPPDIAYQRLKDFRYCHWERYHDDWERISKAVMQKADEASTLWQRHYLLNGWLLLLSQPDFSYERIPPDLADRYFRYIAQTQSEETATLYRTYHDAMASALSGDYAPLETFLEEHPESVPETRRHNITPSPGYEAMKFLCEHHDRLTGSLSRWKHTTDRYVFEDGRSLLVTRDMRMGMASPLSGDLEIEEFPLPATLWNGDPIYMSADRRVCLTFVGFDHVYGLRSNDPEWKHLFANHPWMSSWVNTAINRLSMVGGALMDYVDRHGTLDVALMDGNGCRTYSDYSPECMITHVLRDGTFLDINTGNAQVINHNEALSVAFGSDITIYNILAGDREELPTHYFTNRGVVHRTDDGAFVQLRLPDRDDYPPVTQIVGSAGEVDFALLPNVGTQCYRLDPATNAIEATNLQNHGYPITYWLSRSVAENRQCAREAVANAGYAWPIDLTSRPEADESEETSPAE